MEVSQQAVSTFIYFSHHRDSKLAFSLGSIWTLQSEMYGDPGVSGQCHAVPDRTPTISQDQIRTSLKVQWVKLYHLSVGLQIGSLICAPSLPWACQWTMRSSHIKKGVVDNKHVFVLYQMMFPEIHWFQLFVCLISKTLGQRHARKISFFLWNLLALCC